MSTLDSTSSLLFRALARMAVLQRESVDRLALREAAQSAVGEKSPRKILGMVARHLQVRQARWRRVPDASDLPALIAEPNGDWSILRARNSSGQWVGESWDELAMEWVETILQISSDHQFASLKLLPPYRSSRSPVFGLVTDELLSHKGILAEGAVGGLMLAFLGMLVSFYSMQVYDRVIPGGAYQTLLVLTLGVTLAIIFDYIGKKLRSRLYEQLIDQVDQRLARQIYLRFLSIRLDQMPASVGSLANQLRGYESVRGFLVSLTGHVLVDAPFALFFLAVVAAIGGWLAVIPLVFLLISISLGLWQAGRVRQLTQRSTNVGNLKSGLLVESVEAAEIIKSGQAGWRMLGRWLAATDDARDVDLQIRNINETAQYRAMAMQQLAYVLIVAGGAWLVGHSELTMGGLIACSILSGRVLAPVTQLGMQLTSWASVKASLAGLDALWRLEDDHFGQTQPVYLEQIRGAYRFDGVLMQLRGRPLLNVRELVIREGEKIGIIGPIGAGKTTLLRLLSGMYKPNEGRIWLDDIDLAHLSKALLAEHMGYLPQDGRLLGGSLRDNLILGLMDPGDEAILEVAKLTGLLDSVISPHPQGLQQEIFEGGTGLSGGQRQLVNLTRVFLRKPRIWLLDEPTASLDGQAERTLIDAFKQKVRSNDTLVIVTHKPELLQLVDRLILVVGQQIGLDGPRDEIIKQLQIGNRQKPVEKVPS